MVIFASGKMSKCFCQTLCGKSGGSSTLVVLRVVVVDVVADVVLVTDKYHQIMRDVRKEPI